MESMVSEKEIVVISLMTAEVFSLKKKNNFFLYLFINVNLVTFRIKMKIIFFFC